MRRSIPARGYFFSVAGSKLIQRIRLMCFERVVHMEVGWFDEPENSSGSIGARLSADAATVRALVGDAIAQVVQNVASAVAGLVIAYIACWQLAFIVLALLPLIAINGYVQIKFMKGFSADAKMMYEEASQVANDAVGSIRTVASFCAEEKVMELYRRKCEGPMKTGIREGLIDPLVGHVVHPSPYSQLPTNNDSNYQYNFPDLGGMQFSSPFIQLSKVSGDSSGHYDIALEGENGLSSSKPFTVPGTECTTFREDPVFSLGEIVHPPQLMPETGLEPEVLHYSFNNSELEQARPLATSVTAPTMDNEQPQHSLPTSEGEKIESSSKPLTVPETECATSRQDPLFSHGETIQPQQQLTPESGLEPKDRSKMC